MIISTILAAGLAAGVAQTPEAVTSRIRITSDGQAEKGESKVFLFTQDGNAHVTGHPATEPQFRERAIRGVVAGGPEQLRVFVDGPEGGPGMAPSVLSLSRLGAESDGLGATLSPVDPALRDQLKLPEGKGVIVTSVLPGGPANRSGIEANDILLSLGDHTIGAPEDLAKHLKTIGEEATSLELVRNGEKTSIMVRPRIKVILAPASAAKPRYYLGIQAAAVEGPLRSHLKLEEGKGLTVLDVVADSPAAKAGLQKGDILLKLADKPLGDVEGLLTEVQSIGEKAVTVSLLRRGEKLGIDVTPAARPDSGEDSDEDVIFDFNLGAPEGSPLPSPPVANFHVSPQGKRLLWLNRMTPDGAGNHQIHSLGEGSMQNGQIEELTKQVEELRKSVEELKASIKKD